MNPQSIQTTEPMPSNGFRLVPIDSPELDAYFPGLSRSKRLYACREGILPSGHGGVVVRLGRKVLIRIDRLKDFIAEGGTTSGKQGQETAA